MLNPSAMRVQSGMRPGDITTIDLMYSYENQKTTFQEDTIKRMTNKLKAVKQDNSTIIDSEYQVKLTSFIKTLETIERDHADFYAQR